MGFSHASQAKTMIFLRTGNLLPPTNSISVVLTLIVVDIVKVDSHEIWQAAESRTHHWPLVAVHRRDNLAYLLLKRAILPTCIDSNCSFLLWGHPYTAMIV